MAACNGRSFPFPEPSVILLLCASTSTISALLKARRAETETLLNSAAESAAPVTLDQTRVGRLSRMDALQQQAMAQETERRRKLDLMRIDAALARIEADDYDGA